MESKTKKIVIIGSVTFIVLVIVALAISLPIALKNRDDNSNSTSSNSNTMTSSESFNWTHMATSTMSEPVTTQSENMPPPADMARKNMRRAIIPSAQDESMFQADMPELINPLLARSSIKLAKRADMTGIKSKSSKK